MNLKIKLKNPEYCDGCPYLIYPSNDETGEIVFFCQIYGVNLQEIKKDVIRSQKCIKENGE